MYLNLIRHPASKEKHLHWIQVVVAMLSLWIPEVVHPDVKFETSISERVKAYMVTVNSNCWDVIGCLPAHSLNLEWVIDSTVGKHGMSVISYYRPIEYYSLTVLNTQYEYFEYTRETDAVPIKLLMMPEYVYECIK